QVQVDVKPFPEPIISLTADTTICANELVQLQVSGGDDLYGYAWDNNREGLSCYDACVNPIATPLSSTTYLVSVTNSFGCSSKDSVRVSIVDQSQTFAGEDRLICEGDTVQLQTTMGNNPRWITTEGLDCVYCPDPLAQPDETTNYLVRIFTDEGCEIFDSVRVEVVHPEDVDAGDPSAVCIGQTVPLMASGQGQISWSPAQSLDDPTVIQPNASPQVSTTYTLTVDNGACIITDSVRIEVQQKTEIFTEEVSICQGDSVELMVVGDADQYTWEALPGLSATDIANPIAAPTETTHYQIIASLSSCVPDTAIATVEVLPSPQIPLRPITGFFPGRSLELPAEVSTPGNYRYDWGEGQGLSCNDCPRPSLTLDSSAVYTVTVTDEDNGCSNFAKSLLFPLTSCPLDIIGVPNVFSPNGDGVNDRFEASPTVLLDEIISFRVYNRWGTLLFESTDIEDGWDGTFKGSPQPSGVYVYMIELFCEIDESILVKSGDITLLR
ncbi:MAG: gliding motility-associated C-terminal domain-containing protein, partial [Bacteroidota bacterium]